MVKLKREGLPPDTRRHTYSVDSPQDFFLLTLAKVLEESIFHIGRLAFAFLFSKKIVTSIVKEPGKKEKERQLLSLSEKLASPLLKFRKTFFVLSRVWERKRSRSRIAKYLIHNGLTR